MNNAARTALRVALWSAGIVAVYGAIGALAVPPIAQKVIAQRLGERLGRRVMIDALTVNPYTLHARLKGLRVLERDGTSPFASVGEIDVVASPSSLYRGAPVVDSLTLSAPALHLVRETPSRLNVDDILERLSTAGPRERQPHATPRFSLANLRVDDGRIDIDDRVEHATHHLSGIGLSIPLVSSFPADAARTVRSRLVADVNGSGVVVSAEARPFDARTPASVDVRIGAVDLARYAVYLHGAPLSIASGRMQAQLRLAFARPPHADARLDLAGNVRLEDATLAGADGSVAKLGRVEADIASCDPLRLSASVATLRIGALSALHERWQAGSLEARDISLDLPRHALRIGALSSADGRLELARRADGTLDWPVAAAQPAPAARWDVTLKQAAIGAYAIVVHDAAVKPAAVHRFAIERFAAEDVSNSQGMTGRARARVRFDKGGVVSAESRFALDPLSVEAKIDARDVDLVPLRAYVDEFPAVMVKSASGSAKGRLVVRREGRVTRVDYAGDVGISQLATRDTVNDEELLDWRSMRARSVHLAFASDRPLALSAAAVDVNGAYSRIFVSPAGKLNLQELHAPAGTHTPAATRAAAPQRDIRIGRVTFADSRLNFTDHYIKPNYTADIGALHGSVTDLSSDPAVHANVALLGTWDGASPVAIAGTMNPLAGDLYLDIAAKGEDIDLTRLTAYAQRYAGYAIRDGRLSLDVKYHVEGGKMEGRNRLLVDRLTLGERVASPEATSLPVALAINLLKDANGRIDLELPISGSLDDPKFDFGAVIGQIFSRPLRKAATSPFSLLTGTGADGDDLAFVAFEPGRSDITAAAATKLARLARALRDRPGLTLVIAAHVDTARDAAALQSAERERRIALAGKELSREEREKLARQPVPIPPHALQALAARRAQSVKDFLVSNGTLPAERIAIADDSVSEPRESAAPASRVDLALR